MKKSTHEIKKGGRNKYNAQLFGANTRVVSSHPLRLDGPEINKPEYKSKVSARDKTEKKQYSEEVKNKKTALEQFIKKHIEGLEQNFCLRLCENQKDQTLVWAKINFEKNDEHSMRRSQQLVQKIVEPLREFGARYERSNNCWCLFIPNFEPISPEQLLFTFATQHSLSWTRISHQFNSTVAISLPAISLRVLPMSDAPTQITVNAKPEKDTYGSRQHPTQPSFMLANDGTAEAIKLLTTIQNDEERVAAAQRLNMGKPSLEDTKKVEMQKSKAVLTLNILLTYVKEQRLRTIPYSIIRNNPCLHHNLRLDAEAAMKDAQCPASQILIIQGLNPGIGPIYKQCERAAEKTLRNCTVLMDEADNLYSDQIYRLHGEGNNLNIILEEVVEANNTSKNVK